MGDVVDIKEGKKKEPEPVVPYFDQIQERNKLAKEQQELRRKRDNDQVSLTYQLKRKKK